MMITRNNHIKALCSAPPNQVMDLARALKPLFEVTTMALPENGLGILKLRETAGNDAFFIGEVPVSTAHVALQKDGQTYHGGACILSDNQDLAQSIAILDAILENELSGVVRCRELVEMGLDAIKERDTMRHTILARTKVAFNVLT